MQKKDLISIKNYFSKGLSNMLKKNTLERVRTRAEK
jgi:hypothetical protein